MRTNLARIFALQVVGFAAIAALTASDARAAQPECNNLPSGGYRGKCQTPGGMGSCLQNDEKYCIFTQELLCFQGTCTGDN